MKYPPEHLRNCINCIYRRVEALKIEKWMEDSHGNLNRHYEQLFKIYCENVKIDQMIVETTPSTNCDFWEPRPKPYKEKRK